MSNDQQGATASGEPNDWHGFATAVQFLTRIPLEVPPDRTPAFYANAFRKSLVFFPLVGGLVGLITSIVFLGLHWMGVPPLVAAFVSVGIEALITGAFHEDAFADSCDALGGGWTREQVLEIMKDSRLGTYGTLGLVVGIGVRVSAMSELMAAGATWLVLSIAAAASLGRIAILVFMACTLPVADRMAKTNTLSGTQPISMVWAGIGLSVPFWIGWLVMEPRIALLSVLASAAALFWFRWMILRRVGGTTGDLLGCTAYITQLIILVGASVR